MVISYLPGSTKAQKRGFDFKRSKALNIPKNQLDVSLENTTLQERKKYTFSSVLYLFDEKTLLLTADLCVEVFVLF